MSDRIKTALLAATTWLRANPTKHIAGSLAVDKEGKDCSPNAPEAECFCMLGRISHELNLDGYPADEDPEVETFFRSKDSSEGEIFSENDLGHYRRGPGHCPGTSLANPSVLDYVDRLARDE